jgi:hypothetical protein
MGQALRGGSGVLVRIGFNAEAMKFAADQYSLAAQIDLSITDEMPVGEHRRQTLIDWIDTHHFTHFDGGGMIGRGLESRVKA